MRHRKGKQVDPFYKSAQWFKARAKVLRRDNYQCVNCGVNVRGKGLARVDHILPRKRFPDHALHLPNLRTLCVAGDNARHARDRAGHGVIPDAVQIGPDGFPVGSEWS